MAPGCQLPLPPPSWPSGVRGRLMATMADVVSERGYALTSVRDVLDRTRIARRTFYLHFDNRQDCFFAAYDQIVGDLGSLLTRPGIDVAGMLAALLDYCARWPAHARLVLMEVVAAGPAGTERHEQTMAMLAERLARCGPWQPANTYALDRGELAQAVVGAMTRVIQHQLLSAGPEALPKLLPSLIAMSTRVRAGS